MKKLLSIILTIVMLVMPMAEISAFAVPTVASAKDSANEQISDAAELAADDTKVAVAITMTNGDDSQLKSGKCHWTVPSGTTYYVGDGYKIFALYKPTTRYESTKEGYVVVNQWTDGRNVYNPGDTITLTSDTLVLTPYVIPEGDAYTVNFTIADEFASLYSGPFSLLISAGETLDLTAERFALSEKNGYIVKGWKKSGTDDTALLTSVKGVKDEVITLEAVCVRDVVDIVLENSTITENNGTLELVATVTRPQAPGVEFDRTVTWSIKEGGNKATLDGNKLTAIWNGTVVVTATPAFDATQAKDFEIVITGQEGYEVHYDKNTGAEVTGMPSFADGYDMAKASYSVATDRPSRDGFIFEGWTLSPDSNEIVNRVIDVSSDTTLYAKWMKGGYVTYFDEDGIRMNSQGTTLILADGSQISTDARYASDYAYDAENGVLSLTFGGAVGHAADHRIQFIPNASLNVDVTNSDKIILGFRTDAAGSLPFDFWYATKDADGNWIAEGNNGQPTAATNPYIANKFNVNVTTSGDVNEIHELVLDMSSRKNMWTGYLDHARIGTQDFQRVLTGKKMYYEYIKIIGAQTVETIDLTVKEPKTKQMPYGIDAVTASSDKYDVTDIEWQGELLDGAYFNSNIAYTAKIKLQIKDGYMFSNEPAYVFVNGNNVIDTLEYVDGNAYVYYTFPKTEELKVFTLNVPDAYIDEPYGSVQMSAIFEPSIPDMNVLWSIIDNGNNGVCATIDENGVVTANMNGDIVVRATSVYNPEIYAQAVVSITNQPFRYAVIFNLGTTDMVSGVPDAVFTTGGEFVPEKYNVTREGYFLRGWSTDEDAINPDESFNITEDTVLYAKWGKGYEWTFDDADSAWEIVGKNTISFENGIGTISYNNTSSSIGQFIKIGNLASTLGLDTANYDVLEMRLSIPERTYFLCYYHLNDGANQYGTFSNAYRCDITSVSASASGDFQTVRHDLGNHSRWNDYTYINALRIDIGTANRIQFETSIDYIRIINENRTIKFNGNGGYIPYLDGEVESYKETHPLGDINLPENPTRDGYVFLGWAKSCDDYKKLYNDTFPLSDDSTLYAIWAETDSLTSPDSTTEVTPTVAIADVIDTDEVNGIVVNISDAYYISSDETISYIKYEIDGTAYKVALDAALPSGDFRIVAHFDSLGVDGTIENVVLVLPTGIVESMTIDSIKLGLSFVPGDINEDGVFDYYDGAKLYAYYRGKASVSTYIDTDINGDGIFNYYDISLLYAIYRGKASFN